MSNIFAAKDYPYEPPALPVPVAAPRPALPVWEQEGSGFMAFWRTTAQMLRHPGRTLSQPAFPGYATLTAYALPLLTFYMAALSLYQSLFNNITFIAAHLFVLPLTSMIYLFMTVLLTHFSLLLVGGAQNGWRASFRALSYLSAGCCWLIIPLAGPYIFMIWSLAAYFPACAASHQISKLRVLAGLLALLGLMLFIGTMVVTLVGSAALLQILQSVQGGSGW